VISTGVFEKREERWSPDTSFSGNWNKLAAALLNAVISKLLLVNRAASLICCKSNWLIDWIGISFSIYLKRACNYP
jgi:hypothetical protein